MCAIDGVQYLNFVLYAYKEYKRLIISGVPQKITPVINRFTTKYFEIRININNEKKDAVIFKKSAMPDF
jgi:hypothetical protein